MGQLLGGKWFLEISGNKYKFSKSLAEYLVAVAFLCCHYVNSYITCLTVSFDTVYAFIDIHFLCFFSFKLIILVAFKSVSSQSRCSLEPEHFLRGAGPLPPLNPYWMGLRPPPTPSSSVNTCYICFSADYV